MAAKTELEQANERIHALEAEVSRLKHVKDERAPAVPANNGAYQAYRCPNEGCTYTEKAGKPPFWSTCPQCNRSAGRFLPVAEAKTAEEPAPKPRRAAKRGR